MMQSLMLWKSRCNGGPILKVAPECYKNGVMNLFLCISMTYVISCLEFAKNASYEASEFCWQIARKFLQYLRLRLRHMGRTKYLNPSTLLPYLRDLTHSMTRPLVNISKIFSNIWFIYKFLILSI